VKAQVEAYEKKVEDTPKREQEMILLTRDYETIKASMKTWRSERSTLTSR